jgi:integrase
MRKEFFMARRERNIYRRKDGRFEGRFLKEIGASGKSCYGSVYAKTYAEVKKKLDAIKAQQAQAAQAMWETQEVPEAPEVTEAPEAERVTGARGSKTKTIGMILQKYLESLQTSVKPSTYKIYHGHLVNHIAPGIGKIKYAQLTQPRLQDFFDRKLEMGLSVATAKSMLSFLKTGFKDLPEKEKLAIKLPRAVAYKVEVFSRDEQKMLEATAEKSDPESYVAIMLCLYTGIRIGELCGLTWSDIDFTEKALYIRRTLQRISAGKGGGVPGGLDVACNPGDGGCAEDVRRKNFRKGKTQMALLAPKSPSSERRIPLPDLLLTLLARHKNENQGKYVLARGKTFMEPRTLQYRFKSLLKVCGIRQVNFHATRHTFATRALEVGFDIKTLSEILGHSSATITLNRYAHSLDEHKRSNMESLAALFK